MATKTYTGYFAGPSVPLLTVMPYQMALIVPHHGSVLAVAPSVSALAPSLPQKMPYNGGTYGPAKGGLSLNTSGKFYWSGHNS